MNMLLLGENMNEIRKPLPDRICPALSKKNKVCGKPLSAYDAQGCKTHPEGIGTNKDLIIDPLEAVAWLEIENFFKTPEEFKNLFTYTIYSNEYIEDIVISYVPILSIARALSNKISSKLKMSNTILTYCIDRMIKIYALYDEIDWVPTLCNRGKEVVGFTPQHQLVDYCIERIKLMCILSDVEALKFVLKSEYGYVNKYVKDSTKYEILDLDFNKTMVSPGKTKINRGHLPYNQLWHQQIKQNIPIGIAYLDDIFVVIDGYIRGISAMKLKSTSEKFIVMS